MSTAHTDGRPPPPTTSTSTSAPTRAPASARAARGAGDPASGRRPRSWRRRRWTAVLALVSLVLGVAMLSGGLGLGLPRVGLDIVGAVLALSVAVAGLVLVVGAVVALVRVTPGWWRLPVAALAVVVAAVGTYVLTVPVMVSLPPRGQLGTASPPAGSEEVWFRTADGVRLTAWYVPSGTGAAVILLHGSGSSRAAVVDHAEVLASAGYGVLAFDARGHGESGGRAMRWGWYGDPDVDAAVTYLTGRADVEPDRIAAVGVSMGGEEAIGAAGTDGRLRAVVAEGVTGRTAEDLTWLSDGYGWRGRAQEGLEAAKTAVANLLTPASPPPSLRDAVAAMSPRPVLIVAAGAVEEEQLAAADLAPHGEVSVWVVPGAGHTGGLVTDPDGWADTVLAFLDEHTG